MESVLGQWKPEGPEISLQSEKSNTIVAADASYKDARERLDNLTPN